MSDIRCSNCGNSNPDFLDVCQFCQSPLKHEVTVQIGEEPTKKDTGELEGILPAWLQDARQQGREKTGDDVVSPAPTPRVQKNEPTDLLAGLAFQSDSDEDDVPDWLSSINPVAGKPSSSRATSETEVEPSSFFAQFEQAESKPSVSVESEPMTEDETPAWLAGMQSQNPQPPEQKTEMTGGWPSQDSTELRESVEDNNSWMNNLGSSTESLQEPVKEEKQEDLSWLHNLEADSKQTDDLSSSQKDTGFDFSPAPSSSDEDLSWLNNLGTTSAPSFEDTPSQPASSSSQEDLSWLNNLGGTSASSLEDTPSQPVSSSSQEDLSWLDNLGGASASSPEDTPSQPASSSSQEDLSWLNNLGGTETTSESTPIPSFTQQDETPTSPFLPSNTAPLDQGNVPSSTPDWLKNAIDEPSMPPLGATSMEWFADQNTADEAPVPPTITPDPVQSGAPASSVNDSLSSQDVDSLFDVDMPDWLSREPDSDGASQPSASDELTDDSLAPVALPSWVQAMQPVESMLDDDNSSTSSDKQVTEHEGPLAGFSGVIPSAPIGSSLRPKAITLKLQATDDQQASASLLEQIMAVETLVRPINPSLWVPAQRALRWVLSAMFMLVIAAVLAIGPQNILPVFATSSTNELSNLVSTVPDNSPVLVVIDYEPSLAGELEVVSGPLLDQLALTRKSTFTFIATSPNGAGLVERLMYTTRINQPMPGGLGYQAGAQYFNIGYLPGGSAGVHGFVEDPVKIMPHVNVDGFSSFKALVILTDNAESTRLWVEQLEQMKQSAPAIASQPLFVVSSAQAGPMLEPYVSSGQIDAMINGLSDAAKYEYVNNTRPGTARVYWDAFGIGLMLAIMSIILGSLWSLIAGIRARRAEGEEG